MKSGIISKIEDHCPAIRGFHISLDSPIGSKPGQYVMLELPGPEPIKRAYSVVECKNNDFVIYVKSRGVFTNMLFKSVPGKNVNVHGPYGRFTLPQVPRPLVFIAGGIGITPIFSMIAELLSNGWPYKVHLFYSSKSKRGMCFYNNIGQWDRSKINVHLYLTEEKAEGAYNRRIDVDQIIEKTGVEDFYRAIYYLCGPDKMVCSIYDSLNEKGISNEMIKTEAFA